MSLCHYFFQTLIVINSICSISRIRKEPTLSLLPHLLYNKSTILLCFAAISLFSIALAEMQISTKYDVSKLLPCTMVRYGIMIIKYTSNVSFSRENEFSRSRSFHLQVTDDFPLITFTYFNCKEFIWFIFFIVTVQ